MKPDAKEEERAESKLIEKKEKRKKIALQRKNNVWFGLGMMGMVGWSVVVPTLSGAIAGLWLDKKYPQTFSWTLTLLIAGLLIGSLIAWHWMANEDKVMNTEYDTDNE